MAVDYEFQLLWIQFTNSYFPSNVQVPEIHLRKVRIAETIELKVGWKMRLKVEDTHGYLIHFVLVSDLQSKKGP